jgi:hypothetical protein
MSTANLNKQKHGWDYAITEAKNRIEDLELAIEVYRRNKIEGIPWPGAQSPNQSSAQQHSV